MNILIRTLAPCILALAALAAGCAPFAPGQRDPAPASLPEAYSLYDAWDGDAAPSPQGWWGTFGAPELDALVADALSGDFSVRIAWARLNQALAQARASGAGLTPSLSATGGAAHTRAWSESPMGVETFSLSERYDLGLTASYELDLWGRVRATAEAGTLEALSSRQDVETAAATVAASVAKAWTELMSVREQLRLVRAQVKTSEDILRVQKLLLAASGASALDVLEQRENVASTKALLPDLETQERTLLNQLALLTGRAPGALPAIKGEALPELPRPPAAGLPADLLAERPDVRAAGLSLRATDWQIAAARADRLPTITLTGTGKYSGDGYSTIFDAWTMNLASSLTAPILDGGARAAEVDRLRAVADEHLAAYEQTVVTAVQEVEDALAAELGQRERIKALAAQLDAARAALAEARRRYLGGVDSSYLSMLGALHTVQTLERTLVQERAELVTDRVDLHVALGGDWTSALEQPAPAQTETTTTKNSPARNDS